MATRTVLIHGIDVVREPVENSAVGRGVEERHRGAKDCMEHALVEALCCSVAASKPTARAHEVQQCKEKAKSKKHQNERRGAGVHLLSIVYMRGCVEVFHECVLPQVLG